MKIINSTIGSILKLEEKNNQLQALLDEYKNLVDQHENSIKQYMARLQSLSSQNQTLEKQVKQLASNNERLKASKVPPWYSFIIVGSAIGFSYWNWNV